jgi:EVE domain-containing protein
MRLAPGWTRTKPPAPRFGGSGQAQGRDLHTMQAGAVWRLGASNCRSVFVAVRWRRDHVQRGVAGGFTQANHGKPHLLGKMQRGDWIAFYSPRTHYPDGAPLQAFTAIGQVTDDVPYQVEMVPDFHPWRRNVDFLACDEAPIRGLLDELSFIEDKTRWGYRFRFGVFKIHEDDFAVIRSAMTAG